MTTADFIVQVLENFIFSTKSEKVSLLMLLLGTILHFSSFLTTKWVQTETVSYGLWDQCDNGEKYSCCESVDRFLGATKSATIPAWLGAARTFQCFGLVFSLVSTSSTLHRVLGKTKARKGSKTSTVISTVSTFSTAVCILIGVAIFGGEYKKDSWLNNSHLSDSFGLCVTSGIIFGACGITLVLIGKGKVEEKYITVQKDFVYPETWGPMDENQNLRVESIKQGTQEYKVVIEQFNERIGGLRRQVIEIKRIQNKSLYQQYCAERDKIKRSNPDGQGYERQLWHGTSKTAIEGIKKHGFDRGHCGKNGTRLGKGVYFAVSAGYSAEDVYSTRDDKENKHMYVCKVLTGDFTTGKSDMTVPPVKPNQPSDVIYDSVVDSFENPTIFVIFSDHKAYPEYLITFLPKLKF